MNGMIAEDICHFDFCAHCFVHAFEKLDCKKGVSAGCKEIILIRKGIVSQQFRPDLPQLLCDLHIELLRSRRCIRGGIILFELRFRPLVLRQIEGYNFLIDSGKGFNFLCGNDSLLIINMPVRTNCSPCLVFNMGEQRPY